MRKRDPEYFHRAYHIASELFHNFTNFTGLRYKGLKEKYRQMDIESSKKAVEAYLKRRGREDILTAAGIATHLCDIAGDESYLKRAYDTLNRSRYDGLMVPPDKRIKLRKDVGINRDIFPAQRGHYQPYHFQP